MCVVSMIYQHYSDKWGYPKGPFVYPFMVPPAPSQAEIDEFRALLERAREYDKRNNEPDCGSDDKRAVLKKLAEHWGIDIGFVDEPTK